MADNDDTGRDDGFVPSLVDTAEIAAVADAVHQNPDALVVLQQRAALGELVAGVTHEARNLLTAVLSFVQIGRRKLHDTELVGELLGKSETELLRCIDVLTNVLDSARQSSGTAGESVDANAVIESVVALVRPQMGLRRIALDVQLASGVPRVIANAAELKQVLLNLLVNAMHATRNNHTIRITTAVTTDGGVAIAVSDPGSGIPPELLDKIFQPFFTTKSAQEGTGLGLAVSRRIVEAHGGRLTVESTVGVGTTFEIRLPRDEGEE